MEYEAEYHSAPSSDSLPTQSALRCNFLAASVSAYRLGFKIHVCDWKIEDMTWQASTNKCRRSFSMQTFYLLCPDLLA
jgi:hypothetical protein